MTTPDAYALAERFRHHLRVTDVVDGLDAVGRADITLPDAAIRPLWMGMRFWGPAVTMRVVPSNQRMPPVSREDALRQHGLLFGARAERLGSFGEGLRLQDAIRPGCVVVTSTGGAMETGYWGSNNSMGMQAAGAVGIVTEGNCRDTDEVILQRFSFEEVMNRAFSDIRNGANVRETLEAASQQLESTLARVQ